MYGQPGQNPLRTIDSQGTPYPQSPYVGLYFNI
ncbi:protein of unknown function (plasmid) [Caballeronia sp. S22]